MFLEDLIKVQMAKHSNLYEVYFGPDGSEKGRGYGDLENKFLGSEFSLGGNYGIYDEPDPYDISELEEEDVDITSKIDGQRPHRDIGHKANRQSNFSGGLTNLAEFSNHTNTVVQGISPNLTYRGSKGQKLTKTSMSSTTYPRLYTRPRVDMTATQYGTSRAPLPRHNEDDDNNIFSLNDMIDQHERALHKHTNKVKKLINELNYNFYDI